MTSLTENEKKSLLILFKDFNSYYNANSLSKKLSISRIGSRKILKKLEKEELLIFKEIGKSIVYKPNMYNDYATDVLSFLLSDEANKFRRWKDEFKEIFKQDRIVMLYGSVLINYSKAKDVDIMIIRKKEESGEIHKIIAERQKFISKKVHAIDISSEEFVKNIMQKEKPILDIVKNAVVLFGQNKYVGLIKNVTTF